MGGDLMSDINSIDLAPGIHRVEIVAEDGKLHGYHVLDGPTGPILIDSGYMDAPTEVYQPFLQSQGQDLTDVDQTIITHADADHFGGNRQLREHSPGVTIAIHRTDAPLAESVDTILDVRYRMFEEDHDLVYEQEVYEWLEGMMGPDEPIDIRLRGGEEFRVGDRTVRALHTPGHTRGHLMLYDETHDVIVGADGFFGRGLFDVDGNYLQPPPYFLYPEYENTIQLISSLDPEVLSFTHYEVLRGNEIEAFVQESLDFVAEIETVALDLVDDRGSITLREAIDGVVERRGDFGLNDDLAFPLSAHYRDFVERGILEQTTRDGIIAWSRT